MQDFEIFALVGIIIALCEGAKKAGLSTRYIPLLATLLGILGAVYFGGASWLMTTAGILSALIAQGLYSSFKRAVLDK